MLSMLTLRGTDLRKTHWFLLACGSRRAWYSAQNLVCQAWLARRVSSRDDHYPVCRLDIRQDSEFETGYGYPKTPLKREPDTDPDIRNAFIDISRIQTFEKVARCILIHLLSSFRSIFSAFCAMTPSLSVVYLCTVV